MASTRLCGYVIRFYQFFPGQDAAATAPHDTFVNDIRYAHANQITPTLTIGAIFFPFKDLIC